LSSPEESVEKIANKTKKAEESEVSKETTSASISSPPKVYLKALPLRSLDDVDLVKREVNSGNILILKVSPLAKKSIDDVKRAVGELCEFTQQIGGDIARLGEERVVVTPSFVRIWREKTAAPRKETPTAA